MAAVIKTIKDTRNNQYASNYGEVSVILTNDGAAETNVKKVDASTLAGAAGSELLSLRSIQYSTSVPVTLLWDATAKVPFLVVTGNGKLDFTQDSRGSLLNDAGVGVTGDVLVTTAAGSYTLIATFRKEAGYTSLPS